MEEPSALFFIALLRSYPRMAWRAVDPDTLVSGGEVMFCAGLRLPVGEIVIRLPMRYWHYVQHRHIKTLDILPAVSESNTAHLIACLRQWIETVLD